MPNYVLKAETAHYFVSPYFFVKYAEDFLSASNSRDSSTGFSPVEYYLACHSIELSLKAYLLLKGVSKDEIREKVLGHNLANILEKCSSLKIEELVEITDSQRCLIAELNAWYSRKGFEYFEIKNIKAGVNNLPDVKLAQKLALHLINHLREPCKNEANKP